MAADSWPPSAGLTTQNMPRKDTILCSYGSTTINAPAPFVFDILCDVAKYKEWNSFCPNVDIHSQPDGVSNSDTHLHNGTLFTFHAIMDASKPNNAFATYLQVTDVSTPDNTSSYVSNETLEGDGSFTSNLGKVYRISWSSAGSLMKRGLRTERFHEIIVRGENECEVRTWENQGGLLAHTVKWMYKKTLMEKFQTWCEELKRRCEEKKEHGAAQE